VAAGNRLELRRLPELEELVHSYEVQSPWSYVTAARAKDRFAFAGFVEKDGVWRVGIGWPTERSELEVLRDDFGPVCSASISNDGTIAIGGYGPDMGVRVVDSDTKSLRAFGPAEDRFFHHQVSISPDGRFVYAVSRFIPPSGSEKKEYARLRAWSVDDGKAPVAEKEIVGTVTAVAFQAGRQVMLAVDGKLELWNLMKEASTPSTE